MKSVTLFALLAVVGCAVAAPAAAPPPAVDATYKDTVLKHHNVHRDNHTVADLSWGPNMYAWAREWASQCNFAHNTSIGTKPYGQNIAAGTKPADIAAVITDQLYNGEVNWFNGQYGKASPDLANFGHWGHFTQIVWKGTTRVGCATVDCSKTGIKGLEGSGVTPWMTVCNYFPYGNLLGDFDKNVFKSLGRPTVHANL